jgi:hypothetical protein
MTNFSISHEFPTQLDQQDSLASYREQFVANDPNLIYLDGNSLGRLPKSVIERMKKAVEEEWGADLIRGWNKGWLESPSRSGDKIACSRRGGGAGRGGRSNIHQPVQTRHRRVDTSAAKETHHHRHIQFPIRSLHFTRHC